MMPEITSKDTPFNFLDPVERSRYIQVQIEENLIKIGRENKRLEDHARFVNPNLLSTISAFDILTEDPLIHVYRTVTLPLSIVRRDERFEKLSPYEIIEKGLIQQFRKEDEEGENPFFYPRLEAESEINRAYDYVWKVIQTEKEVKRVTNNWFRRDYILLNQIL